MSILTIKIRRLRNRIKGVLRTWYFRLSPPKSPYQAPGDKLLLHIGCGPVYSPEFVNVDARPLPHVHVVTQNLFDLSAFANDTADLIYMCHLFEHIKRDEQQKVLLEMKRVLKPGGVLRLSVPDFDKLIAMYHATGNSIKAIQFNLYGGQDYDYNYHYAAFNVEEMTWLFKSVGFSAVRHWDPNNCDYHNFDDHANKLIAWEGKLYDICLNLEAIK